MRFYNALHCSNSSTLAKVLKADIAMSTINKTCWSAGFLDAFHGLERSGEHRVRTFQMIPTVSICCRCEKEVEEYLVPGKPARQ